MGRIYDNIRPAHVEHYGRQRSNDEYGTQCVESEHAPGATATFADICRLSDGKPNTYEPDSGFCYAARWNGLAGTTTTTTTENNELPWTRNGISLSQSIPYTDTSRAETKNDNTCSTSICSECPELTRISGI